MMTFDEASRILVAFLDKRARYDDPKYSDIGGPPVFHEQEQTALAVLLGELLGVRGQVVER